MRELVFVCNGNQCEQSVQHRERICLPQHRRIFPQLNRPPPLLHDRFQVTNYLTCGDHSLSIAVMVEVSRQTHIVSGKVLLVPQLFAANTMTSYTRVLDVFIPWPLMHFLQGTRGASFRGCSPMLVTPSMLVWSSHANDRRRYPDSHPFSIADNSEYRNTKSIGIIPMRTIFQVAEQFMFISSRYSPCFWQQRG